MKIANTLAVRLLKNYTATEDCIEQLRRMIANVEARATAVSSTMGNTADRVHGSGGDPDAALVGYVATKMRYEGMIDGFRAEQQLLLDGMARLYELDRRGAMILERRFLDPSAPTAAAVFSEIGIGESAGYEASARAREELAEILDAMVLERHEAGTLGSLEKNELVRGVIARREIRDGDDENGGDDE